MNSTKEDLTYKYFRCSQCDKTRPLSEKKVIRVAYGDYSRESHYQMTYTLHYVFICKKCLQEMEA